MEKINNILCISHSELTSPDTGIMTVASLDWSLRKGELKHAQRGCRGQEAMYIVDSLPWKYKKIAMEKFDIQAEKEKITPFIDTIVQDGGAWDFYSNYTLANGDNLKAELIELYTNTASLLNALTVVKEQANSRREKGGDKRISSAEFWREKSAPLERLREQYKHNLPSHPKSMSRVYGEYMQAGYIALISRKIANANANAIDTEAKSAMLHRLCGDFRNLDAVKVADNYNFVGANMLPPWSAITSRTVLRFVEKHKLSIDASRRGSGVFNNTVAMQHIRSAPTAPMQYWTLDGWDAELYYQKTATNKKGHNVTTYTNRVTIVVVLDPFNKYPIGYAIGDHETPELITEALKNSVNHTRELFGARYRTAQIQSDRYGFKALSNTYAVVAGKVTPARAHNAKAKVIEPYFKYINTRYCQLMPNWSGYGVTASKHLQPNTEQQNLIKKDFPTLGGVVAQLEKIMEFERAVKVEAYAQGFAELADDRKLSLSKENYLLNFGSTTGRTNAIEGTGLTPTIHGSKRAYDCFDMKFRENAHLKWKVMYDPEDLSTALAVSDDGRKRFLLEQKHIQPMALVDRTERDTIELGRVNDFNKQMKAVVTERIMLAANTANKLMLENPALHNSLAKSLITNSLGQHKDARNEIRHQLESGEREQVEGKTKAVKAPKTATVKKQRGYDIEAILNAEPSQPRQMTQAERLSIF